LHNAQIVLLAAQGHTNQEIAAQLGIGCLQVARWRARHLDAGLAGIERDLPRGAPPRTIDADKRIELTTQSLPEAGTHWSCRTLAAKMGIRAHSVMRYRHQHGLKPHWNKTFKGSRDPGLAGKLHDIVGLYLSLSKHAIVLCCDEKAGFKRWAERSYG